MPTGAHKVADGDVVATGAAVAHSVTRLPPGRLTPQRSAVLTVLQRSHDHPTAAEVFDRVRAACAGIGPATVYRSLAHLVGSGLAVELSLGDGAAARYDANIHRHDHVVCTGCGRADDVDAPLPVDAVAGVATATGWQLTGYGLQFHGLCPRCQPGAS